MSIFSPKLKRTLWLPLLIGLGMVGLWQLVGLANGAVSINMDQLQNYEFTVWGDSTNLSNPASVRMVQLSELESIRASIMLLQNRSNRIPFNDLEHSNFHLLTLGSRLPYLEEYLNYYAKVEVSQAQNLNKLPKIDWESCSPLIVAINTPSASPSRISQILFELRKKTELVILNFTRPDKLEEVSDFPSIIQVPSSQSVAQMIAAQSLFGGVAINRAAPDKLAERLQLEKSYFTDKIRLGYCEPERVSIPGDSLRKIDEIVAEGMGAYAFPGCQVLIARKGQVIFHKAYGYHTYSRRRPVRRSDLYDIASITKIAATTLAAMKMYEEEKIALDDNLNNFFEDNSYMPTRVKVYDTIAVKEYHALLDSMAMDSTQSFSLSKDTIRYQDTQYLIGRWSRGRGERRDLSPVFDIKVKDLLTHTSGLPATLPIGYYQQQFRAYRVSQSSEGSFLPSRYMDSLWNETKSLDVDSPRYCYSCVNMLLMQRAIDSLNQLSMAEYLPETFYKPLGLQATSYNPMNTYPTYRIIPTASDRWRGQLIHGTVHDPIAAMMGGVSGNAGLFSNANDLAILAQMWLDGGEYGGRRYFQDSTVNKFTRRHYGHRGLGFDKPPRHTEYIVGESASLASYGHTGFTGTCMWVDPEEELVYIFLSNRIYPSVSNSRINEYRIRQRIHQVVYDAIGKEWRTPPEEKKEPKPLRASAKPDLLMSP
ncbi:MAG: serine hydrolase [Bacteroidia bacterium]|nr:serine hydrolase [Bacteroidia bacterium]